MRWWKNISSYSSEFGSLAAGSAPAAAEEEDDDVDLFGSDDEEDDEEAERIKVNKIYHTLFIKILPILNQNFDTG